MRSAARWSTASRTPRLSTVATGVTTGLLPGAQAQRTELGAVRERTSIPCRLDNTGSPSLAAAWQLSVAKKTCSGLLEVVCKPSAIKTTI